jgi:DNA-binding CsgD family transcriptional regulator/tetratricopeptide (TPR) repeat protein
MIVPAPWSGSTRSSGSARFVGRAPEIARLVAALEAASAGSPATFLIGGEAGVGKTRLLREFADRARAGGARVLCGSCVDLGTGDIPFAPLVDALRGLARELGPDAVRELGGSAAAALTRLAPFLGDQPDPEPAGRQAQSQLFEGTLRLFDLLGDAAPVLFIIEDLHWADRSTLDLLTFLARAVSRERLVIAASFRSGDLRPGHPLRVVVAELDRSRRAQRLELARFDRVELTEFVTGLRGMRPDPDQVARLFDLSDGNAFFVEELVAAGVLDDAPGRRRTPVPKALRDVVITRVEVMSEAAQQVLRTAATAGRRVRHHVLAAACDLPERVLLAAIRECADHGLLMADADERAYAFRHALAREAVYDDLLPGERGRLHADMAAALSADQHHGPGRGGACVTELAHHWFAAGDLPRAFVASLSAATEAAHACAFAESERHFSRALEFWDQVPQAAELAGMPHPQVLRRAADAARWSGHVDRAIELTRRALAELPADQRVERAALHERLGRYLWESGDSAATLAEYVAADRLLAAEPPTALRARVRADQAIGHAGIGDHRLALQLATEALVMARAVGATAEEGRALIVVGVTQAMTGKPDAGIANLRAALEIATANGHLEDLHRAYSNLTYALENTGRMSEALAVAYEALEHSRRLGLLFDSGGMLLTNVAILAFELGRWDEAVEVARGALEHEVFARARPYLSLVLAQVEVGRGRFGDAERRLAEVGRATASTQAPQLTGPHYATLAEMAIWLGRPETARRAVADGLAAFGDLRDHAQALWLCAFGLRVEADEAQRLVARGNQDAALAAVRAGGHEFARQMEKVTDGAGFDELLPEPRALWLQCQGELARLDGSGAAPWWARAARYWGELGWRYPAAYAHWRWAEALLDDHDRDQRATAVLQTAHRLVRELRADPLRHEIVRLARRGRIALSEPADGPPSPPPATAVPPKDQFGLTRREVQVLRHLSEGHTNRRIGRDLFITEKTASVHVSNILTKLGVASRGEAAAIAHRLDLVPPETYDGDPPG